MLQGGCPVHVRPVPALRDTRFRTDYLSRYVITYTRNYVNTRNNVKDPLSLRRNIRSFIRPFRIVVSRDNTANRPWQ